MPEGHTVHRVARQFSANFVGSALEVTSPQGRFSSEANRVSGHNLIQAYAVGKNLFLDFANELTIRVHLGIYGAWDFSGHVKRHESFRDIATHYLASPDGLDTSTLGRDTSTLGRDTSKPISDSAAEQSIASMGAPRISRLRVGERESFSEGVGESALFPPPVIGQVRARLLSEISCADVRGPTVCRVLEDHEVAAVLGRLGPDPLVDDGTGESRFTRTVRSKRIGIGRLLMDQSVVSGIGNVFRAELLFRARMSPFRLGADLTAAEVSSLWHDWCFLLETGVTLGLMLTMSELDAPSRERAVQSVSERHFVYGRAGKPCVVCLSPVSCELLENRKLFWCHTCQT